MVTASRFLLVMALAFVSLESAAADAGKPPAVEPSGRTAAPDAGGHGDHRSDCLSTNNLNHMLSPECLATLGIAKVNGDAPSHATYAAHADEQRPQLRLFKRWGPGEAAESDFWRPISIGLAFFICAAATLLACRKSAGAGGVVGVVTSSLVVLMAALDKIHEALYQIQERILSVDSLKDM